MAKLRWRLGTLASRFLSPGLQRLNEHAPGGVGHLGEGGEGEVAQLGALVAVGTWLILHRQRLIDRYDVVNPVAIRVGVVQTKT